MDNEEQGKKIRQARLRQGLTQKDVADFLCMSDKNYSKIELGQVGISLEYVSKLCQILEMSEVEFLADRRKRAKDWEDLFASDIGGMFNPQINHALYLDMLLRQYLSEEEITYFNEIMKLKNVDKSRRFMMLLPFLSFIDTVNKTKDDDEAFFRYLRVFSENRKNQMNGEFRR